MAYNNPESPIIERTEASFHDRQSAGLLQKTEQGLKPEHFISCTMADTEKKDIYIYVTVRLSNQGFGQIPEAFSNLAKSLFHSEIWPNP